jgi:hypothetical protein
MRPRQLHAGHGANRVSGDEAAMIKNLLELGDSLRSWFDATKASPRT